ERRRQDDHVQLPVAAVHAERGQDRLRRTIDPVAAAAPDGRGRHRPDLPERRAFPVSYGAAERHAGWPRPHARRLPERRAPHALGPPRGPEARRRGLGDHRLPAFGRGGAPAGGRSSLRHAEAGRTGAGAREPPAPAPSRRTGGRSQPRGSARTRAADPPDPRRSRRHRSARRTSHEPRDGRLRPGRGTRFREEDRAGDAGRDPAERGRDPRLSRDRPEMTALLETRNLEAFYGQTRALHGLNFSLNEGSVTTILGANGAGKTTTLRALCGMVRTAG